MSVAIVQDRESLSYPRHLLDGCESGLLLFCSGRMGSADGQWFREAGMEDVACVDWDEKTLEPFANAYPDSWLYMRADVFEWVHEQNGSTWEIVSADAPSQHRWRLAEMLPAYCNLAEKFVTATLCVHAREEPRLPIVPEGWRQMGQPIYRSEWMDNRYWWLVLERA